MSYATAIEQLSAMVPELHTPGNQPRRKFSLEEVRVLLRALGDPHRKFPSVLIAGTNGKGSTAATLASILTEAGLRAGLYISPHLIRVNERIRIGSDEIANEVFARHYFRVREAAEKLAAQGQLPQLPSYFEVLTAVAFSYFAESAVEIAVLEVGMGGRLDATNVVEPLLSVVTDISLDHMEWLGPTVSAIAREKAGILRSNGVLVTLPQHPEANQVLGEVAMELGVRGVNAAAYIPGAGSDTGYELEVLGERVRIASTLQGAHQHRNIALAIASAAELASRPEFQQITARAVADGVARTRWPGRLEKITVWGHEWVLDVAHNSAGAWALRAGLHIAIRDMKDATLIFSCLRDKPVAELAQILFPLFGRVILAPIHSARATAMEDLKAAAEKTGVHAEMAASVEEALRKAVAESAGPIVVSGSVYLVGEARSLLLGAREGAL